ncbi:mCG1033804, partial [Mus musculus]
KVGYLSERERKRKTDRNRQRERDRESQRQRETQRERDTETERGVWERDSLGKSDSPQNAEVDSSNNHAHGRT